jgi:uncharacterized membrane protein
MPVMACLIRLALAIAMKPQHFYGRNHMKTLHAMVVGTVPLLTTSASWAQNGNMMNGGNWGGGWMGGYGGIWMPLLLVIAVAGLVAWIIRRGRK